MFPRVSIIVLNWNGWKDTIECLESLYRIDYPNYDVIVVDNGSKDDSVTKIREYAEGKIKVSSKFFEYSPYNKPIKVFEISEDEAKRGKFNRSLYEKFDVTRRMILIKNKDNYGFAGGNNVGIKFALSILNPEYILLLNNDTVVHREFLDNLIKIIDSRKRIGLVAPFIYWYDNPTKIQMGGEKIRWGVIQYSKKIWQTLHDNIVDECDFTTGVAMCTRASILLDVGLLDEQHFPLLMTDIDFHLQLIKEGYKVVAVRRSKVFHKTSISVKKIPDILLYYKIRDSITIRRKHLKGFKKLYSFLVLPLRIITLSTVAFLWTDSHKKSVTKTILRAIGDGIRGNSLSFIEEKNIIQSFIMDY